MAIARKTLIIARKSLLASFPLGTRIAKIATSLVFLIGALAQAQKGEEMPAIGQVNFFGYGGIDLHAVEASLPIAVGEVLREDTLEKTQSLIKQRIRFVVGHDPTDVDYVCCDDRRQLLIYIGLGGTTSHNPPMNLAPQGTDHLEPEALKLYQHNMDALSNAVRRGVAAEDDSNGYALGSDPELQRIQLAMRVYALDRASELKRVLELSSDPYQRQVAAALLGYSKSSSAQISGLLNAVLDPDSEVRNNAVRAIMVLTSAKKMAPAQINLKSIEELLLSGVWSDRNKASLLLVNMTAARDPALLQELRATVLDPLIEGASWHGDRGHAAAFVILLGRIAHQPEDRLTPIPNALTIAEIIKQVRIQN